MKQLEEILEQVNFKVIRERIFNPAKKDTGFDTLYREDTGDNLGVVSRNYGLATHSEVLEKVAEEFKKSKLPEALPLYLDLPKNGAMMFLELRFSKEFNLSTKSDPDYISPGAIVVNSYNRKLQFDLQGFIYRVVCSNKAVVKESLFQYRSRHTKRLLVDEPVKKFVEVYPNFEKIVIPRLSQMTKEIVPENKILSTLDQFPGWIQEESLQYLAERKFITYKEENNEVEISKTDKKLTVWDFVNTFTFVLTHTGSVSTESRLKYLFTLSSIFSL
jgi:hypothetical protein